MSEFLKTQEVGSLAKPNWRVEGLRENRLSDLHIQDALNWANKLDLNADETELNFRLINDGLACPNIGLRESARHSLKFQAARFAIALQAKAGLDIIYDGEQDRAEMYQHAIEGTEGFVWRGRVRAFDNKSYKKAACIDPPSISRPWHVEEAHRLRNITEKQFKVPITGAYTLGAWSFDEYYNNRRDLVLNLARNVIRPNIQSLLESGVEWIQIDEPAATTVPNEVPLFVESFNESIKGLIGRFSVHICFSDYSLLFPYVQKLENCDQFSLEFANRDSNDLGIDASSRPAYEILQKFKQYNPNSGIGLGVTSVHDDIIEKPELIRDRILRTVDIVGDPSKVYPSPDCGLRTRNWEVALAKLQSTVDGTKLARSKLA